MKNKNKGIAPIIIVLILLGVMIAGGIAYYVGKNQNNFSQNEDILINTENDNKAPNPNPNDGATVCLPTTPAYINITSPIAGNNYTTGQNTNIQWTSCNVQNVYLSLLSGGKNFGLISGETPILASIGTYQWTISNPGKAFTGLDTNNYQIGIESQSPNVMVKSGVFSVTTAKFTAHLDSFTGSNGLFTAKSKGLTAVKVYYYPTGTEITQPSLLGSMTLTGTNGNNQTWSLSAYLHNGTPPLEGIMATSIYAIGYNTPLGGTPQQINQINYPYTGASDIATHLY
ncbi:MAG: hypothetical protein WDK96_03730 [Candidatus Paceibacterota bacterium]